MAKKPESRLQRNIRKALQEKVGGVWYKIWGGPFQQAGIPDFIGCVNGRFYGLEVKIPGKEPSELQKLEIKAIKKAGGTAGVVTSVEEAVAMVRKAEARAERSR